VISPAFIRASKALFRAAVFAEPLLTIMYRLSDYDYKEKIPPSQAFTTRSARFSFWAVPMPAFGQYSGRERAVPRASHSSKCGKFLIFEKHGCIIAGSRAIALTELI
jgi:hypothetical protein